MTASKVHHVALYVSDIKEKIRLMQDVFGMEITEVDGDPEEPRQVWFDGGVQLISAPEEKACRLAHLALTAKDIDATSGLLQQRGADVLPRGNNWIRFADGLVIELMPSEEEL